MTTKTTTQPEVTVESITVKELADRLGVTPNTIYHMVKDGRLPRPTKLTGRALIWKMAAIVAHEETVKYINATADALWDTALKPEINPVLRELAFAQHRFICEIRFPIAARARLCEAAEQVPWLDEKRAILRKEEIEAHTERINGLYKEIIDRLKPPAKPADN